MATVAGRGSLQPGLLAAPVRLRSLGGFGVFGLSEARLSVYPLGPVLVPRTILLGERKALPLFLKAP